MSLRLQEEGQGPTSAFPGAHLAFRRAGGRKGRLPGIIYLVLMFPKLLRDTLRETNIALENRPGPKRKRESLPTIHFQGRTVSFRDGISLHSKLDIFSQFEFVTVSVDLGDLEQSLKNFTSGFA